MPTELETVLIEMLKENTGRHFLDSGGASGRHWQRNQERDFLAEPYATLKVNEDGFEVTKSLFWFLRDAISDYDKKLTETFHAYVTHEDKHGRDRGEWSAYLEPFLQVWAARHDQEYDPSDDWHLQGGYTCCMETLLDQDFVFLTFEDPVSESWRVFLQIHGGCDARGGFTEPRIFGADPEYMYPDNYFTIRVSEPVMDPAQQNFDGSVPAWDEVYPTIFANDSWPVPDLTFVALEDREEDADDKDVVYYDDCGNGYVFIGGFRYPLEVS